MRPRLLIHIGLHKTGTTYYQRSVWPNWKAVAYAGKPRPKNASSLRAAIADIKDPLVFLSDETNSGSLKRAYLQDQTWPQLQSTALENLRDHYQDNYDIAILVSLRRHDRWILSIYKHYLKYGGVETLEDFLGLGASPATIPAQDMLFLNKIRRIEDTLGIKPFCFFLEETRLHPRLLSKHIAEFAGVSTGPVFSQDGRYNEGVNRREATFCRSVNRAILNPRRVGCGSLIRNGTLGHTAAKFCGELGVFGKDAGKLDLTRRAADFVRTHFTDDLVGSVGYLCQGRGLDPDEFQANLDLSL